MERVITNIVIAGLGGQGVLTAAGLLARAAFACGYDVKKAEVHGMSQRGGSVTADVRFGTAILSPMVPDGEADYLLLLNESQRGWVASRVRPEGCILAPDTIDTSALSHPKTLNVAMLGVLSCYLEIPEFVWRTILEDALPSSLLETNLKAFSQGRHAVEANAHGEANG